MPASATGHRTIRPPHIPRAALVGRKSWPVFQGAWQEFWPRIARRKGGLRSRKRRVMILRRPVPDAVATAAAGKAKGRAALFADMENLGHIY
jgi:hypothetical protein